MKTTIKHIAIEKLNSLFILEHITLENDNEVHYFLKKKVGDTYMYIIANNVDANHGKTPPIVRGYYTTANLNGDYSHISCKDREFVSHTLLNHIIKTENLYSKIKHEPFHIVPILDNNPIKIEELINFQARDGCEFVSLNDKCCVFKKFSYRFLNDSLNN